MSIVSALKELAAGVFKAAASKPALEAGDQAPDFRLPGSDGKTYSLADCRGRHVVLAWFPKAATLG